MAKETKKTETVLVETPTENTSLEIGGKEMNLKEVSKMLKDASVGIQINSETFDFEEGEEHRMIFLGMTKMSTNYENPNKDADGKIPAARFYTIDGKFIVVPDAVISGTFAEQKPNTAFLIVCTGQVDGKRGKYKTFAISSLN